MGNFLQLEFRKDHLKPAHLGEEVAVGGVGGVLFKNFFRNARGHPSVTEYLGALWA